MHLEIKNLGKHTTENRLILIFKQALVAGTLFMLFIGCNRAEKIEIPPHIQSLENLIILSSNEVQRYSIQLLKEMEFGSTDDLLVGEIGNFSVDETNKVFVGDTQQHVIHVFDQTGSYIASLGREGRGPGEFQFVGYLKIIDNLLFAFDQLQFRYNVFSATNFELVNTIIVHVRDQKDFDELQDVDLRFMYPVKKRVFLGLFTSPVIYTDPLHPNYNLNDRSRFLFLMDNTGTIISDKILKYPAMQVLTATVNGEYRHTQFEFLGKTLISVSNRSEIYVAKTEDSLIQVFNSKGQYERAYFCPFPKRKFTREQAIKEQKKLYESEYVLEHRLSVINNAPEEQIPQFWPALENMIVDDENRLWISTIVENFDVHEWWVIENTGELITKFKWPREKPIEMVKNGYVYTRETDEETGLQQVVRYRIEFDEVN